MLTDDECYSLSGAKSKYGNYGDGISEPFKGSWPEIPYGCQKLVTANNPTFERILFNTANQNEVPFANRMNVINDHCTLPWCQTSESIIQIWSF